METTTKRPTTKPAVPQATQATQNTDAPRTGTDGPQPAMAVLIVRNDGTMETAPGLTTGAMLQIAEQLRQFALSAPIPVKASQNGH